MEGRQVHLLFDLGDKDLALKPVVLLDNYNPVTFDYEVLWVSVKQFIYEVRNNQGVTVKRFQLSLKNKF